MPVYFNEKTKKYYAAFYYTDWQGIRRKKKKEGFALSRDAKAFEQDFLNKVAGDCNMKFSALCEHYLADCQNRLKATTLMTKITTVKKHFLPVFGDMPLNEITPVIIRKWQNEKIASGFKPTTLRMMNTALSSVFNFAVKYYNLSSNPVKIAGTMGESSTDRMEFWTLDEFNKFIAVVDDPVYKTVFNLLYYTGCRIGELTALTVGDYDATAKTLNINKNYAYVGGKVYITTPKTKKSRRIITLPAKVCTMIDAYINTMYEPLPTERLFYTVTFKRMRNRFSSYIEKAGVKKIRLHDLRHSHASLLIELNFSPLAISERLGHEDIKTTLQTYAHLYPNKATEISDRLNNLVRF